MSDQKYEETVKAAEESREEGYLSGYQLMGIKDSFEVVKEDKIVQTLLFFIYGKQEIF